MILILCARGFELLDGVLTFYNFSLRKQALSLLIYYSVQPLLSSFET